MTDQASAELCEQKSIDAAFEGFRKVHFGAYAKYPVDAYTYFGAGYRAALKSASAAGANCSCDTEHPLFKERGHHPLCPAAEADPNARTGCADDQGKFAIESECCREDTRAFESCAPFDELQRENDQLRALVEEAALNPIGIGAGNESPTYDELYSGTWEHPELAIMGDNRIGIKEIIFATLIHLQGFPPIDTQLAEWEKAVNEIYDGIKDNLHSQPATPAENAEPVAWLAEWDGHKDATANGLRAAEWELKHKRKITPLYMHPHPQPESASTPEEIARELALSYGRDPDAMTSIMEMCDHHNRPVPIWHVYEEQADFLLSKFDITRKP